jgi:hypothetical protein
MAWAELEVGSGDGSETAGSLQGADVCACGVSGAAVLSAKAASDRLFKPFRERSAFTSPQIAV